MAHCEMLQGCLFFHGQLSDMPIQADLFRDLYCKGNNAICGRYLILKSLGSHAVPPDLFPNHEQRARAIIEQCASNKTGGR